MRNFHIKTGLLATLATAGLIMSAAANANAIFTIPMCINVSPAVTGATYSFSSLGVTIQPAIDCYSSAKSMSKKTTGGDCPNLYEFQWEDTSSTLNTYKLDSIVNTYLFFTVPTVTITIPAGPRPPTGDWYPAETETYSCSGNGTMNNMYPMIDTSISGSTHYFAPTAKNMGTALSLGYLSIDYVITPSVSSSDVVSVTMNCKLDSSTL
jgi:hypothetical protein